MIEYLLPVLFLIIFVLSYVKKVNAYKSFISGAKTAINLCIGIFPFLVAILVAVQVFRLSGASSAVADFIGPALQFMGIPKELAELVLLRPLSGAGSIAILDGIYTTYGADTYIGKCASVIYGSSETIFYVATIYFSECSPKKLGPAIPIALIASLLGCIVGCRVVAF